MSRSSAPGRKGPRGQAAPGIPVSPPWAAAQPRAAHRPPPRPLDEGGEVVSPCLPVSWGTTPETAPWRELVGAWVAQEEAAGREARPGGMLESEARLAA